MFLNYKIKYVLILGFLFNVFISCQSAKTLPSGIQEDYKAVNPASIIAVPAFILPDPSTLSSIDPALLNAQLIVQKIQDKIIQSFNGQPYINGHSFNAVSSAIGNNKPTVWNKLDETLRNVANRFNSSETSIRTLITSSCLSRKNFVEFYTYCLAPDSNWINNLNLLSARVLNADTALIVVITNLESRVVNDIYSISGGFSVLLIDTNNGKLIWGKDAASSLVNTKEKKYYPNWDELINKIFTEDFWDQFPGRISKKN